MTPYKLPRVWREDLGMFADDHDARREPVTEQPPAPSRGEAQKPPPKVVNTEFNGYTGPPKRVACVVVEGRRPNARRGECQPYPERYESLRVACEPYRLNGKGQTLIDVQCDCGRIRKALKLGDWCARVVGRCAACSRLRRPPVVLPRSEVFRAE